MNFLDKLLELGPEKIQLLSNPLAIENFNRDNVVSSGIAAIDIGSGIGGLPRNRIIEIFGVESGGKTTTGLHICSVFNAMGMYAAFVDVEHAIDPRYAKKLGIKSSLFSLSQPMDGDEAMEIVLDLAASPDLGVIVLDSVAALMTKQELEGELNDANIGATARLMAKSLRKLVPICSVHNTMVVFMNQLRDNIGAIWGSGTKTPGGRALRYAASMRIEITRISTNTSGKEKVSNETQYTFRKNKLAPPFKEGRFNIVFGKGADNIKTLIEQGVKKGILQKKGNSISYNGQMGTVIQIGKNKQDVAEALAENKELYKEIWDKVCKPKIKKKKVIEKSLVKPKETKATPALLPTEGEDGDNAKMSSVLID